MATGLVGLVWVAFWWPMYRRPQEHPKVSPQELAYIESDPADPPVRIPWGTLLTHRQTWGFAIAKFLTDSIWWFYLFWFAPFMAAQFGVDIKTVGVPMMTVYLMADIGSVLGGWQSSWLIGRGWSVNSARKTAMLTYALCIVPVALAPMAGNKWLAVLLIGIATASHQGFSANLFTLVSDIFPRRAVGSIVGIGGFAGCNWRLLLTVSRRPAQANDRQLCRAVCHGRHGLSGRPGRHPVINSPCRAGGNFGTRQRPPVTYNFPMLAGRLGV